MAEPITYDDFAKVELRVARVVEARPHPNADRLMLHMASASALAEHLDEWESEK